MTEKKIPLLLCEGFIERSREKHVFCLTFLAGSLISSTCEANLGLHRGSVSQLSSLGQVHDLSEPHVLQSLGPL